VGVRHSAFLFLFFFICCDETTNCFCGPRGFVMWEAEGSDLMRESGERWAAKKRARGSGRRVNVQAHPLVADARAGTSRCVRRAQPAGRGP